MEETRYIMQGGSINGEPFEIVIKGKPKKKDFDFFYMLFGETKIKICKAKLELFKDLRIEKVQK